MGLRKETNLRQKARIKWVKDGECNSRLFIRLLVEGSVGVSSRRD